MAGAGCRTCCHVFVVRRVLEIDPPDDDLIRAVLVKLLVDRQLLVDTSVVEFIARRIDRSLDAAREIVRLLDLEALSSGRRISRGLAAEVLRRPRRTRTTGKAE